MLSHFKSHVVPGTAGPGYIIWSLPQLYIKLICCQNPVGPTQNRSFFILQETRHVLQGSECQSFSGKTGGWLSCLAFRITEEKQTSIPIFPNATTHLYVFKENQHMIIELGL